MQHNGFELNHLALRTIHALPLMRGVDAMSAVVTLMRLVSSVASRGLSIFMAILSGRHHPATLARWWLRYQGGEMQPGMQKPRSACCLRGFDWA